MKTRNGFVSNSSSASYIVKIRDTTIHDFCDAIAQEFQYDYFDIEDMISNIKDRVKNILEMKEMGKYYRDEVQRLNLLVARLEALKHYEYCEYYEQPDAELVTDILNQYYRIQTKFYNGDIILTGDSTMHNSIADVPEILKTICMYYLFKVKKELICEVEHD